MPIASLQLEAFLAVAREGGFSAAARRLSLTQSALSQRVKNLEDELGAAVFVRMPGDVQLTEAGRRLLQYGLTNEKLETELLEDLKTRSAPGLRGHVRVAAFSSVMRSAVLPSLKPLLLGNPSMTVELKVAELREIPDLLRQGKVDYAFAYEPISAMRVVSERVGTEENVLIVPRSGAKEAPVLLDHDAEDTITLQFFRAQKAQTPAHEMKRSYLDDIYGLIDGVENGLGRAIVPRHLVHANSKVSVAKGYKSLKLPIHLSYFEQPFPTKLHEEVVRAIRSRFPKSLGSEQI